MFHQLFKSGFSDVLPKQQRGLTATMVNPLKISSLGDSSRIRQKRSYIYVALFSGFNELSV